jgi:sugar phosphate permease
MNEVGALFGAFLLGYASDLTFSKRSPVAILAVSVTSFVMFHLVFEYKQITPLIFKVYLFTFGFFMGGLHHLLCVTCSADIG